MSHPRPTEPAATSPSSSAAAKEQLPDAAPWPHGLIFVDLDDDQEDDDVVVDDGDQDRRPDQDEHAAHADPVVVDGGMSGATIAAITIGVGGENAPPGSSTTTTTSGGGGGGGGMVRDGDGEGRPTGVVWPEARQVPPALLAMVDALKPDPVREISVLLEARLCPPPAAATHRFDELGFLADMITDADAYDAGSPRSTPKRDYYDMNKPPEAPNSQRLCERYGTWTKACRAASTLLGAPACGGRSKARAWSHGFGGGRRPADYTRDEVILAVLRCAAAISRMPSSHAYFTWAARRRREAKLKGASHRLPAPNSVYRHFASWEAVIFEVMKQLEVESAAWRG